ncbi:MAG: hypothetical protein WBA66_07110 [Xanthobacteraceae bacterium]
MRPPLLSIRLDASRGGPGLPRWAPAWAWVRTSTWAAVGRRLVGRMLSSYRPERHYMRGPGPACAAKRRDGAPGPINRASR